MRQIKPKSCTADDELIGVLTAISVVSMRLARKLTLLAGQRKSTEGVKTNEKYSRNHRGSAQMRNNY